MITSANIKASDLNSLLSQFDDVQKVRTEQNINSNFLMNIANIFYAKNPFFSTLMTRLMNEKIVVEKSIEVNPVKYKVTLGMNNDLVFEFKCSFEFHEKKAPSLKIITCDSLDTAVMNQKLGLNDDLYSLLMKDPKSLTFTELVEQKALTEEQLTLLGTLAFNKE